jgi:hypothetical protein
MGSGKFCSECGTSFEIASTPRALLREDAAETIGLDRRLRSTLVDLLRHPVRIVSAYVRGDRSRYIPPFKLFFTLGGLYMLRDQRSRPERDHVDRAHDRSLRVGAALLRRHLTIVSSVLRETA